MKADPLKNKLKYVLWGFEQERKEKWHIQIAQF